MLLKRLRLTLDMIKFEHSVFALPFALTGALLALRETGGFAAQGWQHAALDRCRDGRRALRRAWPSTVWWTPPSTPATRAPRRATSPPASSRRPSRWGFIAATSRRLPLRRLAC